MPTLIEHLFVINKITHSDGYMVKDKALTIAVDSMPTTGKFGMILNFPDDSRRYSFDAPLKGFVEVTVDVAFEKCMGKELEIVFRLEYIYSKKFSVKVTRREFFRWGI